MDFELSYHSYYMSQLSSLKQECALLCRARGQAADLTEHDATRHPAAEHSERRRASPGVVAQGLVAQGVSEETRHHGRACELAERRGLDGSHPAVCRGGLQGDICVPDAAELRVGRSPGSDFLETRNALPAHRCGRSNRPSWDMHASYPRPSTNQSSCPKISSGLG